MRKIDTQDFRRATRDTPREVNRRIILTLLREQGPVSRADLARAMGIPRGMITSLVNELLVDELVVEGALEGDVRAARRVELRSTARVSGRIETPRLAIADGSFFQGACRAGDSAGAAPERSRKDGSP